MRSGSPRVRYTAVRAGRALYARCSVAEKTVVADPARAGVAVSCSCDAVRGAREAPAGAVDTAVAGVARRAHDAYGDALLVQGPASGLGGDGERAHADTRNRRAEGVVPVRRAHDAQPTHLEMINRGERA